MSKLRPYQLELKQAIYQQWAEGAKSVLAVLPTGGGKTVVMGEVAREYTSGGGVAIAHRQELVSQISTALAREGVKHDLICNPGTRRGIVQRHIEETGRNYVTPGSAWRVGGVDTIVRMDPADPWFKSVGLIMQDEAHHVIKTNKWGIACEMFPNAFLLGVTATPLRADGKGLGRHADGLFDAMVEGPGMRDLIEWGYLTEYRIFCPTASDLNLKDLDISTTTGDFNQDQVRKAVHKSTRIVGDVVKHYLLHAAGRLGVTFCVDIESATKIASAYRAAGVTAEVISGKTPDDLRRILLKRFARKEILQLCSVDIMGEGFDLPALEVVSFARPTHSYGLYAQQFGRSLRILPGKTEAIIIDHVGNTLSHNLPDKKRTWTLDRRDRRSRGTAQDAIPLRRCLECTKPYERSEIKCPFCGESAPEPASRGGPEFVDGDLFELTPEVLSKMRGDVAKADGPAIVPAFANPIVKTAVVKNHHARAVAQGELRHAMALWAGANKEHEDRVNYKRFYFLFGVDVMSAKALNAADATELAARIKSTLRSDGYEFTDSQAPSPV